MLRLSSTFGESSRAAAIAIACALAIAATSRDAFAQSCCAGSGAVTPGRLAVHEDALAGLQARVAHVIGSFDAGGRYGTPPPGSSEQDFEQDMIGAVRMPVVDRLQLAVLVPLVETRRSARGAPEVGGGVGDVNVSARYDFLNAGQMKFVPGIAALVGITFPTGRAADSATNTLATDATGIGAFQGNAGIAVEQLFDRWLVSAYAILAKRTARTAQGVRTTLGTSYTAVLAVAYSLPRDFAIALSASYTGEGNADVNGSEQSGTSRRVPVVAVTGVAPLTEHLRLQGGVALNPPIPSLGKNQPATLGFNVAALYAWY